MTSSTSATNTTRTSSITDISNKNTTASTTNATGTADTTNTAPITDVTLIANRLRVPSIACQLFERSISFQNSVGGFPTRDHPYIVSGTAGFPRGMQFQIPSSWEKISFLALFWAASTVQTFPNYTRNSEDLSTISQFGRALTRVSFGRL